MSKKEFHERVHLVAVAFFALGGLVHLIRIWKNLPVTLGTWSIPMWVSWFAVLLAIVLGYLLWKTK